MSRTLVLFHSHCTDGYMARVAAQMRLGDSAVYIPCSYNEAPSERAVDCHLILLDFSYKADQLRELLFRNRSLLVLDHHKTAEADLTWLRKAPLTWAKWMAQVGRIGLEPSERAAATFDMGRAGCGIAWDFFHSAPRPAVLTLVEARDLWKQPMPPGAREVHAALNSHPYDYETWKAMLLSPRHVLEAEGRALLRVHDQKVREIAALTVRRMEIGGHSALVCNCPPWMASDVGHHVGTEIRGPLTAVRTGDDDVTALVRAGFGDVQFVASYTDTAKGRMFSLRSSTGFDVSEVAKKFGGGGHAGAAGFFVPRDHDLAKA